MSRLAAALLSIAVWLASGPATAHDPSAYGGMFRSRNLGSTWLNADVGLFLNAALSVAVDPRESTHLLMGTDLGLVRSRNAGRSWSPEASGIIVGAVFALAFSPDGDSAIAGAPSGVFRAEDGQWMRAEAPEDAAPSRAIAIASERGPIYLLGRTRLFRSDDGGRSFGRVADSLPDAAEMSSLALVTPPSRLLAIIDGGLMLSRDGGRTWQPRGPAPRDAPVDAIALDPAAPTRVWLGQADRLHVSDDAGETWRAVGRALPEAGTVIRGIAADPNAVTLTVTSQRGMFRSEDGGDRWMAMEGNLPVHLEAGPLFRDPSDKQALYAVFSLLPYSEAWRVALEGGSLLARVDRVSLIGGVAFLLLMMLCGWLGVRWLDARRVNAIPTRRSVT